MLGERQAIITVFDGLRSFNFQTSRLTPSFINLARIAVGHLHTTGKLPCHSTVETVESKARDGSRVRTNMERRFFSRVSRKVENWNELGGKARNLEKNTRNVRRDP